jgi:hypothetical protein
LRITIHLEESANLGAVAAFSNLTTVGTLTQDEAKGIEQDGFTGTGFASQYRKPRCEIKLKRVDDDEVTKGYGLQHGSRLLNKGDSECRWILIPM